MDDLITTANPFDWPEDFGLYSCHCVECEKEFTGHKRRVVCKACYFSGVIKKLEKMEAALEKVRYHASTHNLREGNNCECDMCEVFKAVESLSALP